MQTLKQELGKRTPQQLEPIFRYWGMTGLNDRDVKKNIDTLLARVKEPIAARFVWEYLSKNERPVLYRVVGVSARSGARRDATQRKALLSDSDYAAVLATLEQALLIWENTVKIRSERYVSPRKTEPVVEDVVLLYPFEESVSTLYTTGKEIFSSHSDRWQMTLDKILTSASSGNILNIIESHYDITPDPYYNPYNRNDKLTIIKDQLFDEMGAYEILQKLAPKQREIFKWLCLQGGKVHVEALRQHTGYDDNALYNLLHTYEEYALAFDTFASEDGKRYVFIPSDVYASLNKAATGPEPELESSDLRLLETPPPAIQDSATQILYDLAIITGAIYQQIIEPTQPGNVPKRIAAKIRPLLHGKTRIRYADEGDEYLEMVFAVAKELGIARVSTPTIEGVKPRYEPGLSLPQWASMNLAAQARRLLDAWKNSFHWIDIVGINYKAPGGYYYWKPMAARALLLDYLKQCEPGKWYSVKSLVQTIWDQNAFVVREAQYKMRESEKHKTVKMRLQWMTAEGELYIGLLSSSLYEMGIVNLGYQQSEIPDSAHPKNPDAFMITELGAAALAAESKTKAQPVTKAAKTSKAEMDGKDSLDGMNGMNGNRSLVLQPNFEILLLHPDMPALYSLLPFSVVQQVDIVSRLTLTRNSVLRGVETGHDVEEMLAILEQRGTKEVPQNVDYTLRDWVKSYKGAAVSQVLMFEVSSEAVADEIMTSPKLQALQLRKLAPRVLVAPNEINLQEMRRLLEKEGVIVHISDGILTPQNRYRVNAGTLR
jgi:hypothetical protein